MTSSSTTGVRQASGPVLARWQRMCTLVRDAATLPLTTLEVGLLLNHLVLAVDRVTLRAFADSGMGSAALGLSVLALAVAAGVRLAEAHRQDRVLSGLAVVAPRSGVLLAMQELPQMMQACGALLTQAVEDMVAEGYVEHGSREQSNRMTPEGAWLGCFTSLEDAASHTEFTLCARVLVEDDRFTALLELRRDGVGSVAELREEDVLHRSVLLRVKQTDAATEGLAGFLSYCAQRMDWQAQGRQRGFYAPEVSAALAP